MKSLLAPLLLMLQVYTFAANPLQLFPMDNTRWTAVNDNVMGGRSKGSPQITAEGRLHFRGEISLENQGGFSSIRSNSPSYRMPGNGSILLRIRGTNRGYFMDLRTSARQGGFSYRVPFRPTSDTEWEVISLPLSAFRPSAFGVDLPDVAPLDPNAIQSIGFTIYDKKDGPFDLEIESIVFEASAGREPPDFEGVDDPASALLKHAITRGVPLFNAGRPEACAAIYETAILGVLYLPGPNLGPDPEDEKNFKAALKRQADEPSPAEQAWILRRAINQFLERRTRENQE
ncbi:MAG: CIA30 family protein [Verrucomicrobia bacterium]|nr:CIA30 family protein [Verrucomicrobiota bacterium]MCH8512698.1 CIA30 family protein [Kiritimatiellia bacterium]